MGIAEGMETSGLIQGLMLVSTHHEAKKMKEQKGQIFFHVSDFS